MYSFRFPLRRLLLPASASSLNLETLRLTAGERCRGLAELEITETDLLEVPEAAREPRVTMQSLDRLVDGPLERPSDAEPLQLDVEHFALEPRSAADFAGHEDVGQEHHFDEHVPGAFARLAASTRDVERERAGCKPACTRQRLIREQRPQLVERLYVRDRVRAWRAPDRFLIDANDVLQRLPALGTCHAMIDRVIGRRRKSDRHKTAGDCPHFARAPSRRWSAEQNW